ncbi:MAG: rod shape-determining protein MreD [Parcubacteria group bacterium CG10_big_fil_rev_8_21_14_0_10_36_14]|nr:MAG: rod shape-determining protein MreD [Parcubacteria group bacterium CG10_big_fil_rev_8_21_14_0_10_36_14]
MLKQLIIFALVIIGVLTQISIVNTMPFLEHINIVLLFLIYLVLLKNPFVVLFAFVSGYLLDIYSSATFGLNIMAYTIVAFILIFIYLNFFSSSRIIPIIMAFISISLYYFLVNLAILTLSFLKIIPKIEIWSQAIFINILLEILCTTIFIATIYIVGAFLKKRFSNIFIKGSFIKN